MGQLRFFSKSTYASNTKVSYARALLLALLVLLSPAVVAQESLIFASTSLYDFGYVPAGNSAVTTFLLFNSGTTDIQGEASVDSPFTITGESSYTVLAGSTAEVMVSAEPKFPGTFTAVVHFTGSSTGLTGFVQATTILPDLEFPSSSVSDFDFLSISGVSVGDHTGDGISELALVRSQIPQQLKQFANDTGLIIDVVTGASVTSLVPSGRSDEMATGVAVVSVTDLTGDGLDDIAVGTRVPLGALPAKQVGGQSRPAVAIFDSSTGMLLNYIESPNGADDIGSISPFGQNPLDDIEDLDGDGGGEVVMGAPSELVGQTGNLGRVYVFNATTGAVIHMLETPVADVSRGVTFFGAGVAMVPDVNSDGVEDIAVRVFDPIGLSAKQTGTDPIHGYVYSGATGQLLRRLTTPSGGIELLFGAGIAGLNDVNGNGSGDVALLINPPPVAGSLLLYKVEVVVLDGMTGEILSTFSPLGTSEYGFLAFDVSPLGDMNGDGFGDYVVGGSSDPTALGGTTFLNGRVDVVNGATGESFITLGSPQMNNMNISYGFTVAGLDDTDGDGLSDVGVAQSGNLITEISDRFYIYQSSQENVDVVASPRVGDFRNVPVGMLSTITLRIINPGFAPQAGVVTTSPPFEIIEGASYNLESGEFQRVVVGVTPTSSGPLDGQVLAGPLSIPLRGNATAGLGSISGIVTAPAALEEAVRCATVIAFGPEGIEGVAGVDLDGRYRFRELPAGDYRVKVLAPLTNTPDQMTAVLTGQQSQVDFTLAARVGIVNLRGNITSSHNDRPVGGIAVEADYTNSAGMPVLEVTFTCTDGSYEFSLDVAAKAPVRVSTFSGDFFNQVMDVDVTPNDLTENNFTIEVNSSNPGVISGIIRNRSTGGIIRLARIVAKRLSLAGEPAGAKVVGRVIPPVFSGESGEDGSFMIDGLVPGEFEVEVSVEGFETQTGNLTVFEGDLASILDFTFGEAATGGCGALPRSSEGSGRNGDALLLFVVALGLVGARQLRVLKRARL